MLHLHDMSAYAVLTAVTNQPGILFGLSKVLTDRQANITHVDIRDHVDHVGRGDRAEAPDTTRDADIYLEFSCEQPLDAILDDLRRVPGVRGADATPSFSKIY